MANELKEKHQRLKKVRTRNIVLNSICILLAGSGIWWTANYFWRYINYVLASFNCALAVASMFSAD